MRRCPQCNSPNPSDPCLKCGTATAEPDSNYVPPGFKTQPKTFRCLGCAFINDRDCPSNQCYPQGCIFVQNETNTQPE